MATLSESEAGVILSVLGETQVLTALHVAEVIKIKLDLVRGLRKRVAEKKLENAIRDYIADNPWLIDPRFELYRREMSLANVLKAISTAIKLDDHPDFAKRIDLLLANDEHLVLMEFMRPGLTVDLDHIQRFEQYVDELRARIKANTASPFKRITGILVADKLEWSKASLQERLQRLKDSEMFAMEWETLLSNAERQYREYSQIMIDRAPDDPPVRELGSGGP